MPALPWKTFPNVTREREYVVLLFRAPLEVVLGRPGLPAILPADPASVEQRTRSPPILAARPNSAEEVLDPLGVGE
jgi:hypothetical protein